MFWPSMKTRYASFVTAFETWNNALPHHNNWRASACFSLSGAQTVNVVSLALWFPKPSLSDGVIVLILIAIMTLFYLINRPFFARSQPLSPTPIWTDQRWRDPVPSYGEFSRVYQYLVASIGFLLLSLAWRFAP